MNTAILAELVKLTRSTTGRLVTVLLAVAVPAMAAGFVAAAESGGSSQVALKVRPLVHGQGWDALTSTTGQVTSMAMLLGVGFVVSWTFGREFSDGAIETLLMTRPSRAALASATLIAVLGWASATAVASTALMLGLGTLLRLTAGTPWPGLGRTLIGAELTTLLALPFALVATIGRSALAGVGAVIGVIVVTQILTVIGVGPWFPYAAPSLWLGMGGPDLTASAGQLLLVLPLAAAGWAATVLWWQHAELTST
jgi:ABC-2 type transport system permease protein